MNSSALAHQFEEVGNFETIVASMADAVTVHDRDYRIVYQNKAMQQTFGGCTGHHCYAAYKGSNSICPDCIVQSCFQDGMAHSAEWSSVINQQETIFETTASPVRNGAGDIVAAVEVIRDITCRKENEARVRRFMNLYAALSQTNKAIMESTTPHDLFSRVCRAAVEHGKFSLAVVSLIDIEAKVRTVSHCGSAWHYLDHLVVGVDPSTEEGSGPTGTAIRSGVPYICNDFHQDPLTGPWRTAAMQYGINASAVYPFGHEGECFGALKVYADQSGFFDAEINSLLMEMAASIGFGLKRFALEEARKANEDNLKYLSTHDELTGLFNRAYFDAELERVKAGRNYPVSIVVADVDGLKAINDTFGHAAGDRLIKMAAKALKDSFRAEDMVARIGGDEFAVILAGTNATVASECIERIASFSANHSSHGFSLSLSVGCATATRAEELRETLKVADKRMYEEKFRKKEPN